MGNAELAAKPTSTWIGELGGVFAALLALLVVMGPSRASAQVGLRVHEAPESVRVDGVLREWRSVSLARVGSGSDASMQYALGHDRRGLYVIAIVSDDRIVRGGGLGRDQDALVVTLAFPGRGGLRAVDLWLFPGKSGSARAAAGIARPGGRPRPVSRAKVVEAPRRNGRGYRLEAFVPWGALPGSGGWERGRGAIRLRDVDQEAHRKVEAEPASAAVRPDALDRLPPLIAEGTSGALLHAFLAKKNLAGTRPRADLSGDVAGSAKEERVVVVDRFVVVLGHKDGAGYDFLALPVRGGRDVREAGLRDLTGSGKREIVLRLRQRNDQGSRDVWMVFAVGQKGIQPVWGVEVRKKTRAGAVEAKLGVQRRRRGPPVIRVRAGEAEGLSRDDFREASARDVEPILLPWGPVRERRYRWKGREFALVGKKDNPDYEPPARERRRTKRPSRAAAESAPRRRAPTPAQMVAAAKKQLGIPARVRGRFAKTVNVAEDDRSERVVVFGKALVVVGPGFRGGRGYFHSELPVADPEDVLGVRAADLTGDGAKELLIRVRQHFEEGLTRELLLAHCFHDGGFHRILSVEIARSKEGRSVRNRVRLVRDGRRMDVVVAPGEARGWDASSWPFRGSGSGDDVEPLLLPWRDRAVRYGYVPEGGIGRK